MLIELKVSNFAIIDHLQLQFRDGPEHPDRRNGRRQIRHLKEFSPPHG